LDHSPSCCQTLFRSPAMSLMTTRR
jgi:hypothetical protein